MPLNASGADELDIRGVPSGFNDARIELDAKSIVRLFAPDER